MNIPMSRRRVFSLSALGGLESLGKRRKEFARGKGPLRAERAGASESLGLRVRCFFPVVFLLLFLLSPSSAAAATFTTPVTISEGDATYEGQDIVVDGTTATINGPHGFNSLLLTNGAVVTHWRCTTNLAFILDLVVAKTLIVSTNSRIDVSRNKHQSARTSGNTATPQRARHYSPLFHATLIASKRPSQCSNSTP